MSKERELLKRVVEYMWVGDIVEEIKELLAQPESLREGLTREEISQGFRDNDADLDAESFWAGVKYAEKMHGVNNEISIT